MKDGVNREEFVPMRPARWSAGARRPFCCRKFVDGGAGSPAIQGFQSRSRKPVRERALTVSLFAEKQTMVTVTREINFTREVAD